MNNSTQVAKTIIEQLGGSQFVMLTGSKNFGAIENGVSFRVGKNAKRVSFVSITLDANDTYTMNFLNSKGVTVAQAGEVYCDKLQDIFEQETELYVTLKPRSN
jgi:hypothetical protein